MKETIKTIIEWHEQTFPDATLEGQIDKFQQELKEFAATLLEPDADYNHQLEELADMYIVACGIARFSIERALSCFTVVNTFKDLYGLCSFELKEAVDKKMAINRKRKWGIGKGNYQHIEE